MIELFVTYATVPLFDLPGDDTSDVWGNRNWNFFSIPWTASTFGRGKCLVTSDALLEIEAIVIPVEGPQKSGILELSTLEDGVVVPEKSMFFKNIYLSAAHPVHTKVDLDTAGVRRRGNPVREQPGLWEIELVDKRAILMGTLTDLKVNIREPRGTCYFEDSLNNGKLWKYKEVLDALFRLLGVREQDLPVPPFAPSKDPEDINFHQVPVPIAIDYVANQMGLSVHYDPIEDKWLMVTLRSTTPLDSKLAEIRECTHKGGRGKVYPAVSSARDYKVLSRTEWTKDTPPLIPARIRGWETAEDKIDKDFVSPSSQFLGIRSYEGGAGTSSSAIRTTRVLQTARRGSRSSQDVDLVDWITEVAQSGQERGEDMSPMFTQYIGFHKSLSGIGGLTMVTYDWSQGPMTFIERQPIRPSGQIQRNRIGALLRGEPHYLGISTGSGLLAGFDENGWLHIDSTPMWFMGRIMKVYNTVNLEGGEQSDEESDGCTVRPVFGDPGLSADVMGYDIENVWCFTGSWIEVGDIVICFYIGHPSRQWVAMSLPPVVTDKYCPPPDSCRFTGTTSCPDCTTPGDKEFEITGDSIPDLLECVGNTQE